MCLVSSIGHLVSEGSSNVKLSPEMSQDSLPNSAPQSLDLQAVPEVCYMLLYCFACVFNVALDLITTYMVAYRINVGLRMKTYDGGRDDLGCASPRGIADIKHPIGGEGIY